MINDPVLVVVTIIGFGGWAGFVVAALARTGGDRRWDHLFLGSALLIATSLAAWLAYAWIASPM